jgi:hypothetical protein
MMTQLGWSSAQLDLFSIGDNPWTAKLDKIWKSSFRTEDFLDDFLLKYAFLWVIYVVLITQNMLMSQWDR